MRTLNLILLVAFVLLLPHASPATAVVGPSITYGSAVVDGDFSEWDLTQDFFTLLYRNGDANEPVEASVYLRYDCQANTLYILLLAETGIPIGIIEGGTWVGIVGREAKVMDDNPFNDGPPSNFRWINPRPGEPPLADGYEAGFLLEEGTHQIIFHIMVFDGGLWEAATPGYPDGGVGLAIDCGVVPVQPTTWSRIKQVYH